MSVLITTKSASPVWGFSDNILTDAGFVDVSVEHGGEIVSSPIEEGGFTSYNKTTEPIGISATLAFHGTDTFLQSRLDELKKLQGSVTTFAIKTPVMEYQNMALASYDYNLRIEDGLGALYVKAEFTEIKEVTLAYTSGNPITEKSSKDASAVSCVDNGLGQTEELTETGNNLNSNNYSSISEYTAASISLGKITVNYNGGFL